MAGNSLCIVGYTHILREASEAPVLRCQLPVLCGVSTPHFYHLTIPRLFSAAPPTSRRQPLLLNLALFSSHRLSTRNATLRVSATPLLPCHMAGIQRCLLISPPLIAELREPFDLDSWHTESPCCRDQVLIDSPGLMGILSVSCISSLIANHRSDFKSNLQSALGQVRCHDNASLSVFSVSL